jgi:hypothetical protein
MIVTMGTVGRAGLVKQGSLWMGCNRNGAVTEEAKIR